MELKTDSNNNNIPMGISKWREHGIKYGYFDYFALNEMPAKKEMTGYAEFREDKPDFDKNERKFECPRWFILILCLAIAVITVFSVFATNGYLTYRAKIKDMESRSVLMVCDKTSTEAGLIYKCGE